jgi:hypothetical protein
MANRDRSKFILPTTEPEEATREQLAANPEYTRMGRWAIDWETRAKAEVQLLQGLVKIEGRKPNFKAPKVAIMEIGIEIKPFTNW